jgi:hypothetical protein
MKRIICFFTGHTWSYGMYGFSRIRICWRCRRREEEIYYADHEIIGHWERW